MTSTLFSNYIEIAYDVCSVHVLLLWPGKAITPLAHCNPAKADLRGSC